MRMPFSVSLFVARRVALLFACIALALGASMVSGGRLGSLTMPLAHAATNLISNGSFESGTSPWLTNLKNSASASLSQDSSVFYDGAYSGKVAISSVGSPQNDYNVQLGQTGLTLNANTTYTLSYEARSTTGSRVIRAALQQDASPFTEYTTSSCTLGAANTWSACSLTYTPTSTLTGTDLWLNAGQNADTVWFDAISLSGPSYTCGTTYYISTTGSDTNSGTSSSSPWQSLSKASSAALNAGDCLLFQRGDTWTGSLSVSRSGTSVSSITVGAYGTGNLPEITSGTAGAHIVNVTSSYVTLDSLHLVATPPGYSTCGGVSVPEGWIAGFTLESGALHDTIQNDTVSGAQSGIYIVSGANYNTVQDNQLLDNTLYQQSAGSGAYGISLHGSNNTIQYNTINGSHQCSNSYGTDGAAVEVYAGASNTIQYNKANEDDAFSEVTETSADNADSNLFYYNLYWSDLTKSIFVNQHGNVLYTDLYNNTVYLTGSSSQGFLNATGSSMWLRNNIIQAAWKDGWNGGTLSEDYDLFWPTAALRSFTVGTHSKVADPLFTSPGTGSTADFHIPSTSPAVGMGVGLSFTADLDGKAVTNPPDAGAYQH